jgi:hypothetical protein
MFENEPFADLAGVISIHLEGITPVEGAKAFFFEKKQKAFRCLGCGLSG